jgi:anaerobic ribonucleoside-triphosphate reductase activating protein
VFLRIHRFLPLTRVEGPGERACLWVQGCSIRCTGCGVPWTWSSEKGEVIEVNTLVARVLNGPIVEGITFLGGEPFDQAEALAELGSRLKTAGLSIMTFSGYTFEKICSSTRKDWQKLLEITDLLVDGPFCQDLIDLSRPWVGSSNQQYRFLSNRYQHLEEQFHSIPNRLEVRLQSDGQILVNGMATTADLEAFLADL